MDAVTYPDKKVVDFINKHFIPLRLLSEEKHFAEEFNVHWTPTIIIMDQDRTAHHRTMGFLSPEELIPLLYLSIGKASFDAENMDRALVYFDNLLTEYPKSDFAPQGIYLQGVSRYKSTNDPKPLREAYDKLNAKFPASYWTKRAYPYKSINI
jgi:tetratricopeptide (TPR) repeat protein